MLKNIGYTLLSLFTVFKHLFMRPVTLEYPEKKNHKRNGKKENPPAKTFPFFTIFLFFYDFIAHYHILNRKKLLFLRIISLFFEKSI